MNGFGITAFTDADVIPRGLKTYQQSEREGWLTARVACALYADPTGNPDHVMQQIPRLESLRRQAKSSRLIQARMVKIFEDGVIESGTAAMLLKTSVAVRLHAEIVCATNHAPAKSE